MEKTVKAYKVVFENCDGEFLSSSMGGSGLTKYVVGEKTVPNVGCGPLVAFKNAEAGRKYLSWFSHRHFCKVFICDIKESKIKTVWTSASISRDSDKKCLADTCDNVINGEDIIFADWIKLLEEVDIEM
jgi:hypothetical protein